MSGDSSTETRCLCDLMIGHGMSVLVIGLVAGIFLIFSLLGEVVLWPLPAWQVVVPGSARGWQAAHVGGIMNGIMISGAALLLVHLDLRGRAAQWVAYGMIITGWANTLFYWAGNLAPNRGLSVDATPFGSASMAGTLAFIGGASGMLFTFVAAILLARAGFTRSRRNPGEAYFRTRRLRREYADMTLAQRGRSRHMARAFPGASALNSRTGSGPRHLRSFWRQYLRLPQSGKSR